jgi:hypothetical protein
MEIREVIELIKVQLNEFDVERDECEENDMPIDYAYADGAYNAYEFLLKKLTNTEEN